MGKALRMKQILTIAAAVGSAEAKAMTGVNAGGWMVLEPWITPSLFYRCLGGTDGTTAFDTYTFCEVLTAHPEPATANQVLTEHWDTFYTDEIIKSLAERGVEIIRLPIGDWTLDPYGPYVGCTEGAAAKIDLFYDTCAKYNIKVLMDVHAMKDSQNGYDNSGKQSNVEWLDADAFTHWPLQAANWYGDWNFDTETYDHINFGSVNWGLQVHEALLQRWGAHSAFYAFEPINEPQNQPIVEVL